MAAINIKNIPDHIHRKLKLRAAANHRSLNKEVLHLLEQAVALNPTRHPDAEEILRQARAIRKKMKGHLTIEEIDAAINEGRP